MTPIQENKDITASMINDVSKKLEYLCSSTDNLRRYEVSHFLIKKARNKMTHLKPKKKKRKK